MALWGQYIFQDAGSAIMEMMIFFHDHAMLVIVLILSLILYMIFSMMFSGYINRFLFHGQLIEMFWTFLPVMFLIFISVPSLKILYLIDEINNPNVSVKVLGNQWYWTYEYDDFNNNSVKFDSFMLNNSISISDEFRLLDVDNRLILPINNQVRFLISSLDVIHSFAIPSLGIKIDAVPGRINQVGIGCNRVGLFYGQCSEICGVNHSFMPVVIEVTLVNKFIDWLENFNDGDFEDDKMFVDDM